MLAPIPGMSLTKTPKNQPWEQPPMFNTKEEALGFYFERLNDPEKLDDMLFLMKRKFPIQTFVESMTSYGVMEGYHTPDVKVIIAPILHEHIKMLLEALNIGYIEWEGPSDEEKKSKKEKERMQILIQEALEDPSAPAVEEVEQAKEALQGDKEPLIKRRK